MALGAFAAEVRTAERPAGALDLLGWLELLWEDAPHLVVAGVNDGNVPEATVGDVFCRRRCVSASGSTPMRSGLPGMHIC